MGKTIPAIASQHAEDAAFHWLLRDVAVRAPHYSLTDLAKLDGCLEAHLDGLCIAADAGWAIVIKDELKWEEAGEAFTGLYLAVQSGDPLRIKEVLAVANQSLAAARGAISALGWLSYEAASPIIQQLVGSEISSWRRIAVGALAAHRVVAHKGFARLLEEGEPLVRARALKAVGELRGRDYLHECVASFQHEDPECRFQAAWSAVLLGESRAISVLQEVATGCGRRAEHACAMAARGMGPAAAPGWIRYLVAGEDTTRLAVVAAGAHGDPVTVPWLIELMSIAPLARVAGESLSFITGVDLAYEDLEGEQPDGFEAGPTEDPKDENVALDPDEDLPWPDPELVARWWSANASRFQPGKRYLMGAPIAMDSLMNTLRYGKQRQRAAAALEIALLRPGEPLFEVRARGDVQRRLLGV